MPTCMSGRLERVCNSVIPVRRRRSSASRGIGDRVPDVIDRVRELRSKRDDAAVCRAFEAAGVVGVVGADIAPGPVGEQPTGTAIRPLCGQCSALDDTLAETPVIAPARPLRRFEGRSGPSPTCTLPGPCRQRGGTALQNGCRDNRDLFANCVRRERKILPMQPATKAPRRVSRREPRDASDADVSSENTPQTMTNGARRARHRNRGPGTEVR